MHFYSTRPDITEIQQIYYIYFYESLEDILVTILCGLGFFLES